MTDIPTQAPTDSAVPPGPAQGEPAGVSSAALTEMRDRFRDSARPDKRQYAALFTELLAARQQLAEMRGAVQNKLPETLLDAAAIADQRDTLLGLVVVAEELLREAPLPSHKAVDEWIARRDHYLREREAPYSDVLKQMSAPTSQPERGKCEEAAPYSDVLSHLAWALRGLHEDVSEYQRINHLGGYDNHWMKAAREALEAYQIARTPKPDCAQGGSPAAPERQDDADAYCCPSCGRMYGTDKQVLQHLYDKTPSPALREAEHVLTQQERDGLHRAHQRSVVTIDPPPVSAALREAAKAGAMMLQNYCAQLPADHPWQAQAALLNAFAEGK